MNANTANARPKSFWVVAILALLWNLIGTAMFYLQVSMTPEQLAALPAPQREVCEATPAWLYGLFGIAVIGGVLGSLGLLLKKKWAAALFLISLLAVVAQTVATFVVTPAWSAFGAAGLVMPVIVLAIAIFLWRYSRQAAAKGWLG